MPLLSDMPFDELESCQGTSHQPLPDDFDTYWDAAVDELGEGWMHVDPLHP